MKAGTPRSYLLVTNQTRGTILCPHASLADTSRTRLFGLLGKPGLAAGTGLLIQPSSGVHTWGMRFPIDIVALDRHHHVAGLWRSVGAWRIRGLSLKTRSVLELAPGAIDRSQTQPGDLLTLTAM